MCDNDGVVPREKMTRVEEVTAVLKEIFFPIIAKEIVPHRQTRI
jgi:hypothetical protein